MKYLGMPAHAGQMRGCVALMLSVLCTFAAAAADSDTSTAAPLAAPLEAPISQQSSPVPTVRKADFGRETPSAAVQDIADRVLQATDNQNLPFMVIDKVQARVYVFRADGTLRGATNALLGLAIGDHTVPGIGQRKLSTIRPDERTTPAGRFMATLDRDIHGVDVMWIDYDSSFSLHRVVPGTPKERRAQRLASPSSSERRISYGCVNVPPRFYDEVVGPSFKGTYGVVYVLPEVRPASEVFSFYKAQEAVRSAASQ